MPGVFTCKIFSKTDSHMHSHLRDGRLGDPLGVHRHHDEGLVLVGLSIACVCQEASPVRLGGWHETMAWYSGLSCFSEQNHQTIFLALLPSRFVLIVLLFGFRRVCCSFYFSILLDQYLSLPCFCLASEEFAVQTISLFYLTNFVLACNPLVIHILVPLITRSPPTLLINREF